MAKCPVVFIRPVDHKLFGYLYAYKVATSHQIGRDIFPGLSMVAVAKRLKKLRDLGYLRAEVHPETGRWLVYSLTPETFRTYITSSGDLRRELRSGAVVHDLDLVDVAYHLRRSGRASAYYPENLIVSGLVTSDGEGREAKCLRAVADVRADAAVELAFDTGTFLFAVEYEASLKAKARYKALFETYLAAPDIPIVLYVCREEHLKSRLQAYEAEFVANATAKFFYTTLRDLKEKMAPTFTNRKGEVLCLGSGFATVN